MSPTPMSFVRWSDSRPSGGFDSTHPSIRAQKEPRRGHTALYALDPLFPATLEAFAPGACLDDVPTLFSGEGANVLAFDDSWSFLGWSRLLSDCLDSARRVTLLHADAHADLDAPHLLQSPDGWVDGITGQYFTLDDDQVARAIVSGAIGIGMFVTPLLHLLPRVSIRHLSPRPGPTARTRLQPTHLMPRQASVGLSRMAVVAHRSRPDENPSHTYIRTHDPTEWCAHIERSDDILLHIDLDYFENRHDGANAWVERPVPVAQVAAEAVERVNHMCSALATLTSSRVRSTTIGLSPGFCPSELWPGLLDVLQRNLVALEIPYPHPS